MFKLIVGLGNPGRNYEKTRHNAGFWFLDELVCELGLAWSIQSRFQGWLASCPVNGQKVLFLKPDTFMNRSGQAVGKTARYFNISPDEILVVHDDLDFDAGIVKLKKDGGHAGHNGLRDIITHLASKDFYRLRVGIGRPGQGGNVADYVLSEPSKTDREKIARALDPVLNARDLMFTGQLDEFMNQLH